MGGTGRVVWRGVWRGFGVPLSWQGGSGSVAREEKKCLYSKKIFANFVETSCVRQYGLGGIGGKDLCRPDISFLRWRGFFSMGEMRRFTTFVQMALLWTGCSRIIVTLLQV